MTGEKGGEEESVQFLEEAGESPKGGECFSDGIISVAKSQKNCFGNEERG